MAQVALPRSTPGEPRRPAPVAPARRHAPHATWQWLWAPFWLGSEVPVFASSTDAATAHDLGPAGDVVRSGLDQLRRRLWARHAVHLLVRAGWLTLAIGCLWQLLDLVGGPRFEWRGLLWIGIPLAGLALSFAILNRPDRQRTAHMLDRSFGLQDRLATALDHLGQGVPREGERASIGYLQMADAANVINELKRHRLLRFRPPVRELVPTLGFALLLVALFFLRGTGDTIPPVAAASVPRFTPAVARPPAPEQAALSPENTALAPTVEEVMEQAQRSDSAQRDLQELANALADHATTRPAAEAINQGNFEAAGDRLREFAPRTDQLSPAAREALARDLEQAADAMSPQNQDLQESTEQAADGLRQGGEAAQTGVEELGDEVARTGEQVASPQELADQMQRAQEGERRQQQQQARSRGSGADPNSQSEEGESPPETAGAEGENSQQPNDGTEQGGEPSQDPGQSPAESGDAGSGGQGAEGNPGQEMAGQGSEALMPAPSSGRALDAQNADAGESSQSAGAAGGESEGDSTQQGEQRANSGSTRRGGAGEAEQRVTTGSGERVQAEDPDATSAEVRLPSAPGGDGMQTANNAGGTVRGSGAGITAGSGDATQAEVAEAGPDSNRVPEEYRPVVERYFSDLDDN